MRGTALPVIQHESYMRSMTPRPSETDSSHARTFSAPMVPALPGTWTRLRADSWGRTMDVWSRLWGSDQYRCQECGYDLRGLSAPDDVLRCPECSEITHRCNAFVVPRKPTSWRHRLRVPLLVVLGLWLCWLIVGRATVLIVPVGAFMALVLYWANAMRPTTTLGRNLPLLAQRLGHGPKRTRFDNVLTDSLEPGDAGSVTPLHRRS